MSGNNIKKLLESGSKLRVIETVNALEAIIIKEVGGFDGLWLSGLCHAAFKGMPDDESMPFEYKLDALRKIKNVSELPIFVDCDTGGEADEFCSRIEKMQGLAEAVVIEDKKGIKKNSLYGNDVRHEMEDVEVFSDKLKKASKIAKKADIMLFARIESLITREGLDTALKRAESYIKAGADGIVIHSVRQDGRDVFAFSEEFHRRFNCIPLVMIPTVYNGFTFDELCEKGADIVIYANQLTRSACMAMEKTARSILSEGNSKFADENYCISPKKLLSMIEGERK